MRFLLSSVFLILTLVISTCALAADDLYVSADVSSREVPLNENMVFSITISGSVRGVPEPVFPPLAGFRKIGQSSSSSISIINMSMTTEKKISYTLQPRKKGDFIIPAVSFSYHGKTYRTNPVEVRVVDAVQHTRRRRRAQSPFGGFFDDPFSFRDRRQITEDDVFARMVPDLNEVYINQEIVLTFSLYYAEGLQFYQDPAYTPPSFKGLWAEDVPVKNRGEYRTLNNRRFIVSRVKHAVFPVSDGELTIGGASVTVQFDPFSSPVKVMSKPVKIKVIPLPPPPPGIDETSLVGSFGIYAELDKIETKTGEPVELTVTIKGIGNIHAIRSPVAPALDSFEIYGPEEDERMKKERGFVEGEKVFKYILIPRDEGEFTIGAFKSAYFDPEKKIYRKLQTGGFTVKVLRGKAPQKSTGSSVSKNEVSLLGKDINYIRGNKSSLAHYDGPLYRKPFYLFLIFFPPALILLSLLIKTLRSRRERDPAFLRRSRAFKTAEKRVRELEGSVSMKESRLFYSDLENILRHYIGDKLNISPPSVDPSALESTINGDGSGELLTNIRDLFEKCGLARFSTSDLSAKEREESLKISRETINKLEKYL